MIYPHMGQYSVFLKYPVNLLLFAPYYVPVVIPGLLPLAIGKPIVHCIFECGFEFYVISWLLSAYGGFG